MRKRYNCPHVRTHETGGPAQPAWGPGASILQLHGDAERASRGAEIRRHSGRGAGAFPDRGSGCGFGAAPLKVAKTFIFNSLLEDVWRRSPDPVGRGLVMNLMAFGAVFATVPEVPCKNSEGGVPAGAAAKAVMRAASRLETREPRLAPCVSVGVLRAWKYPHADAWGWTVVFIRYRCKTRVPTRHVPGRATGEDGIS